MGKFSRTGRGIVFEEDGLMMVTKKEKTTRKTDFYQVSDQIFDWKNRIIFLCCV